MTKSDRQLLSDALNFISGVLSEQSNHSNGDAQLIRQANELLSRADNAEAVRPRAGTPYYTPAFHNCEKCGAVVTASNAVIDAHTYCGSDCKERH